MKILHLCSLLLKKLFRAVSHTILSVDIILFPKFMQIKELAVAVNLLGPFCSWFFGVVFCFVFWGFFKHTSHISENFAFFFNMQILHNKSFGTSLTSANFTVILVQLIIFICETVNHVFLTHSDLKNAISIECALITVGNV